MTRSVWLALTFATLITAWMVSGQFAETEATEPNEAADGSQPVPVLPMKVAVMRTTASDVEREMMLQGQLEPVRRVVLKAETAGKIVSVKVDKGARVSAEQVIVALDLEDRPARLRQAKAEVASRAADLKAAKSLGARSMQAKTAIHAAEAAHELARAGLARIRSEIDWATVRAPFPGVINARAVELGDFLDRGDPVAELVDDTTLRVSAYVPQHAVGKLQVGAPARVRLITGETVPGTVTFVAAAAETETRSFRVEVNIDNPDRAYKAGISAEVGIVTDIVRAHFVSLATLSLDEQGDLGVKTVDSAAKVGFAPIRIVKTGADGAWVSGLPEAAIVITLGHGFVQTGDVVSPVESEAADSGQARREG